MHFVGDLFNEAADAAMEAMKGRLANQYYMKAEEAWALMEEWKCWLAKKKPQNDSYSASRPCLHAVFNVLFDKCSVLVLVMLILDQVLKECDMGMCWFEISDILRC